MSSKEIPPSILKREWEGFLEFVVPLLFDLLKGLTIFATLLVFAWALQLGSRFGLESEYATAFGKAHFWLSFSAFVILGVAFISRLVYSIVRGRL
jgi:hypothetical protein